jgi:hypothetical protein
MLADPARRTLLSRSARRVCGTVSAYRRLIAVRGCALLATDSQDATVSWRSAFRWQSVVAETPYPHSVLLLTSIIPIANCEGYSHGPPHVLCITNTVG